MPRKRTKKNSYTVSYKVRDETAPRTLEIKAQDAACALSMALYAYDGDEEPDVDWVAVTRERTRAPHLLSLDTLPPQLLNAYRKGLC